MSDTAVTPKGFNLIVTRSVEVLQKYSETLQLGEVKPFTDVLELATKAAADDTEMAKAQARTAHVSMLPANGQGATYFIIPSEGVWEDTADAMDRFVCALAEIGAPLQTRFLPDNVAVLDESRVDVLVSKSLPWLDMIIRAEICGNYEGSPIQRVISEEEQMIQLGRIHSQFVIGNVKKGEVFIVNEVGFLALADFNFWAAFEAYRHHADYINGQKEIDDFLLAMTCAKTFGTDEDTVVEAEFQAAIETWNTYDGDKQRTLAFNIAENVPTIAQLIDVQRLVPCDSLNVFQILIFALELDNVYDGSSIRDHVAKATDAQKANPEYWTNIQRWISESRHKAHEAALKEQYGFLIRPVPAKEDGGINAVHTEDATSLVGFEAFVGSAHMGVDGLATFVENLVLMVSDGAIEDIYAVTTSHGRLPDGTPLRSKVVEADPKLAHEAGLLPVLAEGTRALQILIPDPTNKLPDEEGYDHENFPQPIYALVKPAGQALN